MLFVGHDASRTGAPIMLLHLLRWLRAHTDIDFDLLLPKDGPLVEEYGAVCEVFIGGSGASGSRLAAMKERLRSCLRPSPRPGPQALRAKLAQRHIGLVYSNTVTNGDLIDWLAPLRCPVVCHAHEVDSFFRSMSVADLARLARAASAYIALTEPMVASLVRSGVPADRITRVPGFLPLPAVTSRDVKRRRRFCQQHRIPEDAVLIGGCGTVHWQKGPDLLVHVANLAATRPGLRRRHFAWVGGREGDAQVKQLLWDVEQSKLSDHFAVIPGVADVADYLNSLDILALTSRDDPQPLVAMEAGAHRVPVVCFSGNAVMVDDQCGRIVPYLDLQRFANSVCELADDEGLRVALGERLSERIRAQYAVSVQAPVIADIIRQALGPAAGHA